jgi:hypothetical protein
VPKEAEIGAVSKWSCKLLESGMWSEMGGFVQVARYSEPDRATQKGMLSRKTWRFAAQRLL